MAQAAQVLRAAGFPLVLEESAVGEQRSRADVVAYAPASDGGLRPAVVVEIKKLASDRSRDDALDRLADARHALGTRLHYVFDGTAWFEADSGLRGLRPVPGPARNDASGPFRVTDPLLVEHLLSQQLWRFADLHRGHRHVADSVGALVASLAENRSIHVGDSQIPVDTGLLWVAARELALRVQSDRRDADAATDQLIARAMAQLAGAKGRMYFDPFCGVGSLLWHAADQLQAAGGSAQLQGLDINATVVSRAQAFARLCPLPLNVGLGDAFQQLSSPSVGVTQAGDRVLAQPPLGLRLQQPHTLVNGEETSDGDLATLDVCLRALQPGGRAVFQLGRGWTFRSGASLRYRQFLAETTRVAAIIGLPSGAVRGAGVSSVITVIEKARPGTTFIAQLEQDWQQQLSTDGAAMRAVLAHLDAPGEVSGLL